MRLQIVEPQFTTISPRVTGDIVPSEKVGSSGSVRVARIGWDSPLSFRSTFTGLP